LLTLLTLVGAPPAAARQVAHNAAPGQTLESISLRYYGVAELAESLRVHNALGRGPLTPGSVIEIPLADDHEVASGEQWSTLADRYWGDRELGPALALLVEPSGATLEPGTRLRVPALVHHRVRRGESLAVLTRRSYGSSERIQALALLNGIENPNRIAVEQPLRLPVLGQVPGEDAWVVRARPDRPDPPDVGAARAVRLPSVPIEPQGAAPPAAAAPAAAAIAPPPLRPDPAAPDMTQALSDAVEAYYQGEFDVAREALRALRPDLLAFGTERQQHTLLSHLLLVHVAFDDAAAACRSWAQLRGHLDDAVLDPDRFSPKVRHMSRDCDSP